jgi:ABC-type transport system involved in multi-copper enzyme maturation permease subunit
VAAGHTIDKFPYRTRRRLRRLLSSVAAGHTFDKFPCRTSVAACGAAPKVGQNVVCIVTTIGMTLLFGFGNSSILEYGQRLAMTVSAQLKLHCTFAAVFCMIAFISKSAGLTIIESVVYVLPFSIFMSFAGSFEEISFLTKIIPQYYIASFHELHHDTGFMLGSMAVSIFYVVIPSAIGIVVFNKADIK